MASAYSYDLRVKAINAVKSGQKKINVCRMFGISRNTLDLWFKREQETGDFKAVNSDRQGRKPKIKELQRFQEFVLQHSKKTQQQIAALWEEPLTQQNVSDAMKKLGNNQKKKPMDTAKEMRRRENSFLSGLSR